MLINLFDVDGKKVVPGQACYLIPWLKRIMDMYPDYYLNIYNYIFHLTCPDGTINSYVNFPEEEKESILLSDLAPIQFDLEDPIILDTIERCRKMYETPVLRAFNGAKRMLDRIGSYLDREEIIDGKEGNAMTIKAFMKELPDYWETYRKMENILKEEQSKVRGDRSIPYWQQEGFKETKEY